MISLIVPIRGECPGAAARLQPFAIPGETEILVAAADAPETCRSLARLGARILEAGGSRGSRLDRAAREARGRILFFLHADSRPPANAVELVCETIASGAEAGAFSLDYEQRTRALAWIAWWANLRSRWLHLPFGDQGIFCRREAYERSGGFRDLPVCDDLDWVRRLRKTGRFVVLRDKTLTSPARYRERGPLRQVLRNWRVLAGYYAGVSPEKLERWYNAE